MKRTNQPLHRIAIGFALAITAGLCYLSAISRGQGDTPAPADVRPVALDQSPAELKIAAALQEQTSLEFLDIPLREVAAYLSERHNIPVLLDQRSLDSVGIGGDTPISITVKGVRLRSALDLLLKELELVAIIRDEVLLITTGEEAESSLVSHAYDVRDLMKSPYSERLAPDDLIHLLTTVVAPYTWDEVGGTGSADSFNGTLIVSQTQEVHEQVQALLTQLRRARHALQHDPSRAFATRWDISAMFRSEMTNKVIAALDKPVPTLEYLEVPLSEVVLHLQKQMEIPILLDTRALDGVGIGSDTPITANLSGITLRSALKLMLAELDLTWVVRDEVLLITIVEEAESHLETSVFLVRDLLESSSVADADTDALIELLTSTVAPSSWDEVGGPGSIMEFELLDALVVSQTSDALDEIEILLAKLRKIRNERDPWSAEEWAEEREQYLATPRFEYFTISQTPAGHFAADPETVVRFLDRSLDKAVLDHAQIKFSQNALTMFLTPRELEQVKELLHKANLPVHHSTGMLGGGIISGRGMSGGFF